MSQIHTQSEAIEYGREECLLYFLITEWEYRVFSKGPMHEMWISKGRTKILQYYWDRKKARKSLVLYIIPPGGAVLTHKEIGFLNFAECLEYIKNMPTED